MPSVVLEIYASVLTPCLVKIFRLSVSTSTFHSCWKYAYTQPVPKKVDCSNLSNYSLITLVSCISKGFETIFNSKILKHLSAFKLLSNCQYRFGKGRSPCYLLPFLTNSLSSSLTHFSEIFAVALDMSKAFDRVKHKSLLCKLPSFGFCPSFLSFISSFLSGRSISGIVDGHCSTPKPINSGVPQYSVVPPTLSLLFTNELSITTVLYTPMPMTPLYITPPPSIGDQPSSNSTIQGWMPQDA